MFGIPAETPYDLRFRLLAIPVRVSPWFWVVTALFGWQGNDAAGVVEWIGCVFVSILVHEFGHGLTARRLVGQQPSVVLHGMGGACTYDRAHGYAWKRIAVLAMGPGAGFLLAGLVALVGTFLLGLYPVLRWPLVLDFQPTSSGTPYVTNLAAHFQLMRIYFDLLYINIFWGLFNLLPIYPLDGGQLAATGLQMHDPQEGQRRAFILSFVTAAGLAALAYSRNATYLAFFLGYLALMNFQFLQEATHRQRYGDMGEEDDNWWRR